MLANTGTFSFIVYGTFIVITVIAMVFAFYYIIKGSVEAAKLDKIIELFKYVIVSTAIATVSLIVTDLFREREQDVKELEYFDKYVDDVKKVDGIQERLQLAKYLSIVAPGGELKKSWQNYYDTVKIEYAEYLRLKSEQLKADALSDKTEAQKIKYDQNQEKIRLYEKPLASTEKELTYTADAVSAQRWEEKGFAFLLNRDVENAISAFRSSENADHGFHMVYEIAQYLNANKTKLTDANSPFWKEANKKIATDFSWKMAPEIKARLLQNAQ